MLKHTIHISLPMHLSLRNHQLVLRNKDTEDKQIVPIEDIATLILANRQITLSAAVLSACIAQDISVISCDDKFMPIGRFMSLDGHTQQQAVIAAQLESPIPLRKQLWQRTIQAKVYNQARLLESLGINALHLQELVKQVKSGDSTGIESQAARYYWGHYFQTINDHHHITDSTFRDRMGAAPNHWLNYGYAILRSLVARALTASGLLPVVGIHHHNKYNAYCLADDIMEPYRPMVDQVVHQLAMSHPLQDDIPKVIKQALLQMPTLDCLLGKKKWTLQAAIERTTASLAQSFQHKNNQIIYPVIHVV